MTSPHFFLQHDSESPAAIQLNGLDIVVYSRRDPDKETPNEDAAVIIPVGDGSAVLAVADGVGGVRGADQASNLALQTLEQSIRETCSDPTVLRVAILDGIEQANTAILDTSTGACTTLAVVEFHAGSIRPYHVGDSMILVTGQRGRIRHQSVSHSPVGFAVESGLLHEDDALHHDDRHLVSNVVGDDSMRIELGPQLRLNHRDTVLLASDGLFDNLRIEEIVETIRSGDLPAAVDQLTTSARTRMQQPTENLPSKPDDLTVIAFRQIV